MIFKNAMSFKAKIKQIAKEKDLTTQQVQQNYLIEVFLEKLSKSKYKNNLILKGGYIIGSIVGIGQRSTLDLDTTIKGFDLTPKKLTRIVENVISIPTEESFRLSFKSVREIREEDSYPGYKVKMYADFEKIHEVVLVDVTTGDAITPREIKFSVKRLFSNGKLSVLSYSTENIVAEKIETILSRGVATTRPRDFYDVYILFKLRKDEISISSLSSALDNTMRKRESTFDVADYSHILKHIRYSAVQQSFWKNYQSKYSYARELTFEDVVGAVYKCIEKILEYRNQ